MTGDPQRPRASDHDWSWTEDDPSWVPPEIDTTRPSPARMYDFALGGKDNFEVDREAVRQAAKVMPDFREIALANRGFLVRAVAAMADAGIDQFVDLGTGIPTSPNVHEVARVAVPDARVVYVDNDPIVMAHNRALRAVLPGVITVQHDLRDPAAVLEDPEVRELIAPDRPVGMLFVAVLHFVRRDVAPQVVDRFRRAMPPGSHLAVSAACTDGTDTATVRHIEEVYAGTPTPFVFRSAAEIEHLFEGFELLDPGLTDVSAWRGDGQQASVRMLCGVGLRR